MEAVKYYLQYQGFRGTKKQIEKLLKTTPLETVERMARERGYKDSTERV